MTNCTGTRTFFLIGLNQTLLFWRIIANLLVSNLYFLFLLTHNLPGLEFIIKEHQNLLYLFELGPKVIVYDNECEDVSQIDHYDTSIEQVDYACDISQHPYTLTFVNFNQIGQYHREKPGVNTTMREILGKVVEEVIVLAVEI